MFLSRFLNCFWSDFTKSEYQYAFSVSAQLSLVDQQPSFTSRTSLIFIIFFLFFFFYILNKLQLKLKLMNKQLALVAKNQ